MKRLIFRKKTKERLPTQLELNIAREQEPDRNLSKGGRSFYFFDFDDNIAFLQTPIYLFHKKTKKPLKLSSREYALYRGEVGSEGHLKDYEYCFSKKGSFAGFRDKEFSRLEKYFGLKQNFEADVEQALQREDFNWKGPSWHCFYHAVFNQRPISLITARGHHPETIKKGIDCFVKKGFLPAKPNFLDIYPVNHPETQSELGYALSESHDVAQLKKTAIRKSVERAFEVYGNNPHHRFGMSDDDPKNLEMIYEEMIELKKDYPENSFFVILTHKGRFVKKEIFQNETLNTLLKAKPEQLTLL